MNIDAIVGKIAEDARAGAEQTLTAARGKAEALQNAAEQQAQAQREAAEQAAKAQAEELRDRMLRMAALEQRKAQLSAKRAEIDRAFERALEMMRAMPEQDAEALHLRLLMGNARGDEQLLIDAADVSRFGDAFMKRANEALVKAGKPGKLTLSNAHRPIGGGFILCRDGLEVNCGYEALLREARGDLEGEVAAILFPA